MKNYMKYSIFIGLLTALLFSSCDDTMSKVGLSIQPREDVITVYTDTFQMKASTVRLDSVYAKTSDCLLGEMYDPVYGIIKSDLLCQFYCEEGFRFHQTPVDHKIDSVELLIFYPLSAVGSIMAYGDTLSPMQLTVYPVNKPLKKNFYTNEQPELYCDMQNPLGSATYTLYDMSVPDSIRFSYEYDYAPFIRVKLPTALGQKIYDETINNPATFDNQSLFNAFFPGVYITNTYGSGNLVKTAGENIAMRIFFTIPREPTEENSDTISTTAEWFYVSKDVIQINRFENNNLDQLLTENPTHAFIKSLAGVCTKLVLPTTQISKEIDFNGRYINGFTLTLKYLPEDERDFPYTPPQHLLLLPEDSVTSFFENANVENNVTSFISFAPDDGSYTYTSANATPGGYSSYTRTYSFGNISRILKNSIENSPEKDLSLLLIPVTRKTTTYNSVYYTIGISHSFFLSGVKLRTDEEHMKVTVLSSRYEEK